MFKNLIKAAVAVVVAPIDVVVDVVTGINSCADGKDVFHRTKARFDQAGEALDAALEPGDE